ncbi:peptidylprolyl isomerase [Pseudobacter ginsenosidimutans]|uniref:Peptidyl-prolyl cis-trans isomerase n=1 Tax=Pseudobacter ginsenosidimutans TaxID=661488 RepID=A0A4Q7MRI2_9BACT|nr:peptidylprolyl isomerase [Pseudobacter ginsenosidimutans]QEC41829.1 peptidylprolyl isomerase [Pseudobacter ginsenosidimutans]RZS71355.1 peptidyl-prolyl cis-trans isomerase B (cyclophilin B) [Pseudobacter ginsenosidimutans]
MNRLLALAALLLTFAACNPRLSNGLRVHDLQKDVELVTSKGTILIRLSDSTPLHRDNFIRLVQKKYFDSILFHRVINQFMVQAGDPDSKRAKAGAELGNGGPGYTVPAEFRASLFHKKGVIAAARTGDDVNPMKASSGSQFYLVQGKVFTEAGLDSVENMRLRRKLPAAHREVYKTLGGTPHLDQNYTVFGEVISGLNVVDSIAVVPTSGRMGSDRPLADVRIIRARLVKRK